MRKIAILLALLYVGCESGPPEPPPPPPGHQEARVWDFNNIYVWHDDKRAVTCWLTYERSSISCLPDSQIKE